MALVRPRWRRLVFPLSSEIENLEGHVDDGDLKPGLRWP